MLGNLLDEYIEGNFYVGNNEKIPPEKLELAPLIERIAETKLFLNNDCLLYTSDAADEL